MIFVANHILVNIAENVHGHTRASADIKCRTYSSPWGNAQVSVIIPEIGEPDAVRTRDPLIKSQMLYRLSYGLPREQPFGTVCFGGQCG